MKGLIMVQLIKLNRKNRYLSLREKITGPIFSSLVARSQTKYVTTVKVINFKGFNFCGLGS